MNINGTNSNKNNFKNKYFMELGILSLILCIMMIVFFTIGKTIIKWENKIYKNITINEIDMSGKTKEEAMELVNLNFLGLVNEKQLKIKVNSSYVDILYSDINPRYDVEKAIDKALSIGKDYSKFDKYKAIKFGVDENIEIEFTYDEENLQDKVNELNQLVAKEPVNAKITIEDGEIEVIDDVVGKEIDYVRAINLIKANINSNVEEINQSLELPIKDKFAKITGESLNTINTKIATASTNFNTGDISRTTNLKIATEHINGTILLPEEVFSYNDIVGERSIERGFKEGASFVGGEVVESIGGGICQISTTLYQAISKAGIVPTERYNHTMAVTYAKPSEDATVAWGYLDYKFKNTYKMPIYIEGIISDGIVTFNIYGNNSLLNGYTYDLVGIPTGTTNPGSKRINDSSLPRGTEIIEKRPAAGKISDGYLVKYKDGIEIERQKISSDIYGAVEGVIRYGTGN